MVEPLFYSKGVSDLESAKFIICGEDKRTLGSIKNTMVSEGFSYIGYIKEPFSILRAIRTHSPQIVIIDLSRKFTELRPILEVIDEEKLTACILALDLRSDEIFEFINKSSVMTYITKPVYDEAILQMVDIAMVNFHRVTQYEEKVRKLNDTLENRKLIEKAKWILVEQQKFSESEAYEWIKKRSRDSRTPMRDIANAIILTRG